MAKVSVIIPVYNVEKYVAKCAESLFGQTLDDLEYIFVNDCTPDNSVGVIQNVLKNFPQRRTQVNIINLEHNVGQAAVRKIGISAASGDYIIFCDGDDWVAKDMYECLYNKALQEKADVVRCDFLRTTNSQSFRCLQIPLGAYADKELLISYLLRFFDLSSTCDKLVKRELYQAEDFVYPTDNMCEDLLFVTQIFLRANKIVYLDKALYYYRQNESSISHIVTLEHICNKAEQIAANVNKVNYILSQHYGNRFANKEILVAKLMAKEAYRPLIHAPEVYLLWKNCFKEINSKIIFNSAISWRKKLLFVLCYLKIYPLFNRILG